MQTRPDHGAYDVVIVGGAAVGSAIAWFLSRDPDFNGRVLLIERDPTWSQASTALSASCIRHQYSNSVNVRMSMFASDLITRIKEWTGDQDAPEITLKPIGYMFLATADKAHVLRRNHATQTTCGAATQLLSPDEIAERFPFYNLEDIALGSFNNVGEGWFDGYGLTQYFNATARKNGVEAIHNEVTDIDLKAGNVRAVRLKSGETVAAGNIINAGGPRAARIAEMAGIALPVEPRKRCLFVFDCREDLGQPLPLTIDPTGVHFRSEGQYFLAGTVPDPDKAVDDDDLELVESEFEEIWAILAQRIPAFEAIRMIRGWAGHYAMNTFDQNAILGPHPEITNFFFANGFSGHGLQQSPAVGRGITELIVHGRYRTLDLHELGFERIIEGRPFLEQSII